MLRPMLKAGPGYWFTVALLALVVIFALFGYWLVMILNGMGLAGIRRPVGWGVFIATFVFWIGISHSGTFVSAILRVFNAEFRRPITRAAELMTYLLADLRRRCSRSSTLVGRGPSTTCFRFPTSATSGRTFSRRWPGTCWPSRPT